MSHFRIKVADLVADVKTLHTRPQAVCRDFITNEEACFFVETNQSDIEYVREELNKIDDNHGKWDGYLEVIALQNKLLDKFIDYNVILMHGAAISVHGAAILFCAPSGTGKTTHIRKWIEKCPETFVVNGDKPFIRMDEGSWPLAYGTPWAGKENVYNNTSAPLEAIVLMERCEDNRIFSISFSDALPLLLQQTHIPEDPVALKKTIELLVRMKDKIRFFKFFCNNCKDDCFQIAYDALINSKES